MRSRSKLINAMNAEIRLINKDIIASKQSIADLELDLDFYSNLEIIN